jgi:hypothetical protein
MNPPGSFASVQVPPFAVATANAWSPESADGGVS